jgi:oligosaccharide repeat unit polymerase
MILYQTGLLEILSSGEHGLLDGLAINRLEASNNQLLTEVGWYLEAWHIAYVYYLPLAFYLYKQGQLSRRSLAAVIGIAGVSSVLLFSRVHFVMVVIFSFVPWVVLFRPSQKALIRLLVLLIPGSILLFGGMQYILLRSDVHSNAQWGSEVAVYSFSSAAAFQQLTDGNYHEDNQHNALYIGQGVYYALGKLSLLPSEEYPIGYRAFVFIPDATNVYTFLDSFALDFGVSGIILCPFVMGSGMGLIWNRLVRRTTYPLLMIYALCVYSCSIANLANFLVTQAALIFVGTVIVLSLILPGKQRRTRTMFLIRARAA